jgi:hypothetical protein
MGVAVIEHGEATAGALRVEDGCGGRGRCDALVREGTRFKVRSAKQKGEERVRRRLSVTKHRQRRTSLCNHHNGSIHAEPTARTAFFAAGQRTPSLLPLQLNPHALQRRAVSTSCISVSFGVIAPPPQSQHYLSTTTVDTPLEQDHHSICAPEYSLMLFEVICM